ncbi:MAG: hypothetical protein NT069_19695 [Planctomycetota bacterium]|nr:hypothetical protein [Planctomycetota bacterium]
MPQLLSRRWISACVALAGFTLSSASPLMAADAKPAVPAAPAVVVGEPASLTLVPEKFTLTGKRARQQLLATGQYANAEVRDLTIATEYVSNNPST